MYVCLTMSGEVPCMFYNPRIGCYAHSLGYFHLLEVPRRIFDGHNNGHWTFFPYPKSTSKRDLYVRYESNVIQHEIFPFLCSIVPLEPKEDIA